MSWLARSIANSLKLDDDHDHDQNQKIINVDREEKADKQLDQIDPSSSPPSPSSPGRGVKEDLSELTKTLTRQFWGVASFLAPPPPPDSEPSPPRAGGEDDPEGPDAAGIGGIRSDFAEIGGKFKSGISKLSNNIAAAEFTKIASNLLQLGAEKEGDYDSEAVGVTEEVVAFARDIAMHPETWLDFPLPDDGDDDDDDEFDMSDAQQEHALAVESLAPRLSALRIELCPGYMSEDCFWKIYFVLVHPRLSKEDALLLSTPQIMKARASLTQELQKRTKVKPQQDVPEIGNPYSVDISNAQREESLSVPSSSRSESASYEPSTIKSPTSPVSADSGTEKHTVSSNNIQIVEKNIVEEVPVNTRNVEISHSSSSSVVMEDKYEDDGDDWLKEENSEIVGDRVTAIPIEDEDVSFSDLEDDDEIVPTNKTK